MPEDRATEESSLITRIAAGDRDALRELYLRYSGPLYALALRMTGDPRDAEERLQDTFVKIWHNAPAYDASLSRPFTWAVTIARRTCIDALRRRDRVPLVELDDAVTAEAASAAGNPREDTTRDDDASRVRAALGALPSDQRTAVDLAIFGALPQTEIARRMQQPLGTVKSWIRRGLQELRNATRGD